MIRKKKVKFLVIALFFAMAGIFSTNGVICHAANPTIECIDSPIVNYSTAISSAKLNVSGWALSDTGVKQVEILVDGKFLGNASVGESRPDVAKAFPNYSNGAASGYSYALDVSNLSPSNHQLTVETIGNNGTTTSESMNFSTYAETSMTCIDAPSQALTYYTNQIQIGGWALNPSGVKSVQIYCDNNVQGQAQIGQSRPDVQNAYKGYSGANTSGYSYTLDGTQLRSGSHTIKVVSTGNDGSTNIQSRQLNIAGLVHCVDFPQQNKAYGNSLTVSGWAMDPSGISKIQVYVDGNYVKDTVLGQSRPDVAKVFPNYKNNVMSGYTIPLDISSLANANHTVTLKYIAVNGDTESTDVQIQKGLPAITCIDAPSGIVNGSGTSIFVSGWALNCSGIKQINVLVDNKQLGTATIGLSRPDVNNAYTAYNIVNSGFSYSLNVSHIGVGTHTITIQSIGNDGSTNLSSTRITRPDNIMCIDSPRDVLNASNNPNSTAIVSGWALNIAGIKEVDILVDGQNVGAATIDIARPDVKNAYPVYNIVNSGFSYNLDVSHIGEGTHTITIQAIGNDGSTNSSSTRITRPNNMIYIDSPRDLQNVNNTVSISGWALNITGIKEVDILVDGQNVGTATIGITRPDVNNAYPAYNIVNSGFSYSLDVSKLSGETHTITIQAIGNDGSTNSGSTRITRPNNIMCIDSPRDLQNVNNTISVSGWALDMLGMKEVDIIVDGQSVGTATIGITRQDVKNVYPAYNIVNSGFNYNLDVSKFSNGVHRITVNAIGNSGQIVSSNVLVAVGSLSIYKGADVSEWNDISDYQQFKSSGVQVVIQKATQGETFIDSLLTYREKNLKAYGFLIGYYHYANNDNNPDAQAQHFLNTINGATSDTVLWLDIENEGDWSKQQAVAFTKEFINYVQARGHKIGIYTGEYFYNDYLKDSYFNVPMWIANYGRQPSQYPSVSWQYTDSGSVAGVKGDIDLDWFNNFIFN